MSWRDCGRITRRSSGDRAVRGDGREVHRRCGHGGVRCAGGARGRCRTRRAGGVADHRGDRRPQPRASWTGSLRPRRGEHGRGAGVALRAPGARRGDRHGRCRQHRVALAGGCARRWRGGRGAEVSRDAIRDRVRAVGPRGGQGQAGAAADLARAASARSVARDRAGDNAVHRTRRGTGVVAADVHPSGAGVVGAVGHGDRRAGRREEPVDE
ncbi:MAG: hypothetical protein AVDCRST_MAG67-3402 [uncultured Solirubrobacteraceae bacterium]|uniref:Uncharacterized protein n=1 Tax=uncultured Solirubrobacteraceae bacterium TaxID=1162706 RepID=A0A6J4TEB5_9ACTN|nr:MAG: hypothetical protein AVDCRST_MAG67-3402 [uncultured Solirubrobacteraceae bacterium]